MDGATGLPWRKTNGNLMSDGANMFILPIAAEVREGAAANGKKWGLKRVVGGVEDGEDCVSG
jgi:hypothetical protein